MYEEIFTIGVSRVRQEPVTPRPRKHPPMTQTQKRIRFIVGKLQEAFAYLCVFSFLAAIEYAFIWVALTQCLTH